MKRIYFFLCVVFCSFAVQAAYLPGTKEIRAVQQQVGAPYVWFTESGKPTTSLRALSEALEGAFAHGLNVVDYTPAMVRGALVQGGGAEVSALDAEITRVALRYIHDLHVGRSQPHVLPSMHMKARKINTVSLLAKGLKQADFALYLEDLAPKHNTYQALKRELRDRVKYYPKSKDWPKIPVGKKLKLGAKGARVQSLRNRLAAEGFLRDAASRGKTYDEPLAHAVSLFQARYNMNPDGVAGTRTIEMMNMSKEDRIKQVIANMERWRWVAREWGDKYIHVNIPGYSIEAVQNGMVKSKMRAIVGHTDAKTRTAIADTTVSNITFNPRWNVPQRIAKDSILPIVKRNPAYLRSGGYTMRDRSTGQRVDPQTVDWEAVNKENFDYAISQAPGKRNALGSIRFYVDRNSAMHIHDTSKPELFERDFRALSNGCVRAERPYELAEFVLEEKGTPEKIAAARKPMNHRVNLKAPVKTYMQYWTMLPDEKGRMHVYYDIYGYDKILARKLKIDSYLPEMLGMSGQIEEAKK